MNPLGLELKGKPSSVLLNKISGEVLDGRSDITWAASRDFFFFALRRFGGGGGGGGGLVSAQHLLSRDPAHLLGQPNDVLISNLLSGSCPSLSSSALLNSPQPYCLRPMI